MRTRRVRDVSLLCALSLALLACDSPSPERVVATATTTQLVKPRVSWPTGARDDRAFAALGDPTHAAALLGEAPVPVLAPTNLHASTPTFLVGPEYYALTLHLDGVTVAIQGTRAAHHYEEIAPVTGNRALRGEHGFVTTNEGIRTTSWTENGASYSVDVECADPAESRCSSETFVLDLVEQLAFAGRGPR